LSRTEVGKVWWDAQHHGGVFQSNNEQQGLIVKKGLLSFDADFIDK